MGVIDLVLVFRQSFENRAIGKKGKRVFQTDGALADIIAYYVCPTQYMDGIEIGLILVHTIKLVLPFFQKYKKQSVHRAR